MQGSDRGSVKPGPGAAEDGSSAAEDGFSAAEDGDCQPWGEDRLVIDCDLCEMQGTEVCEDCVVSFLCRTEPSAVVIDLASVRALRTLSDGGLVPELRHRLVEGVGPR